MYKTLQQVWSSPVDLVFRFNCRLILFQYNNLSSMSGQKKLSAFFKAVPKRPLSEVHDNDFSPKKQKLEDSTKNETPEKKPIDKIKSSHNGSSLDSNIKEKNETPEKKPIEKVKPSLVNGSFFDSNIKEEIMQLSKKYSIIDPNIGCSWFKALKSEFKKPYFEKLNKFVEEERKKGEVFPPANQVWSWTRECSMDKVKVVILGQDPYHNPRQAHGLCFSVQIGIPPPPSLLNMYKELETDIEGFKAPKHGYLIGWARQGVLLLNAVLTVKKFNANSHKDQGWEDLTTAVIKYLNDNYKGIVFLLWGSYAQKKASFVDQKKHHILKTVHPSPLSAQRGWFGCKHFSKCNELLKQNGKKPIDWSLLPEE